MTLDKFIELLRAVENGHEVEFDFSIHDGVRTICTMIGAIEFFEAVRAADDEITIKKKAQTDEHRLKVYEPLQGPSTQ